MASGSTSTTACGSTTSPSQAGRPSMARKLSSPMPRTPAGEPLQSAGTTPTAPSMATPSRIATGPIAICSTALWPRTSASPTTSTFRWNKWFARSRSPAGRRPSPLQLRCPPPLPDRDRSPGQHAFQLLHTDQADFVFLHFAVPHSPNIWSRIRNDYTQTCDSSYLDSLALADHILGRVLSTLQASPRWNQTSLIVQGDHSWRIDAWDWLPAWTQEDDAASRETFDPRPAVIIHQAGQQQPQTVSTAWPIIQIHGVVEQVLHNQPPTFAPPTKP